MRRKRRLGRLRGWWERRSSSEVEILDHHAARAWCDERAGRDDLRHYERTQTAAGGPAAGETSVELTYLAQLGSWLTVQPDVQYVIHPGGTRATRNAVVPGLRVTVSH